MTFDPLRTKIDATTARARKAWNKPTIVVASASDDTQDGGTTGTDDGNGLNDYTLDFIS